MTAMTMESSKKRIVEVWALRDLKAYPKHGQLSIPPLDEAGRARLRADIAEHGLEHPLDIYPDKTKGVAYVMGGHERYLAVRDLGWKVVDCRLRCDLDTEEKRDAFVMRDNLIRRHLTESQKAALATRLADIYGKDMPKKEARERAAADVKVRPAALCARDEVAKAAAETPAFAVIEQAADKGEVDLATAANAAKLPPRARERVANQYAGTRSGQKNRTLATFVDREKGGDGFDLGGEPASLTHPEETRKNCDALDALEVVSAKGCATVRELVVAMRRASASVSGKDLPALTRFFKAVTNAIG